MDAAAAASAPSECAAEQPRSCCVRVLSAAEAVHRQLVERLAAAEAQHGALRCRMDAAKAEAHAQARRAAALRRRRRGRRRQVSGSSSSILRAALRRTADRIARGQAGVVRARLDAMSAHEVSDRAALRAAEARLRCAADTAWRALSAASAEQRQQAVWVRWDVGGTGGVVGCDSVASLSALRYLLSGCGDLSLQDLVNRRRTHIRCGGSCVGSLQLARPSADSRWASLGLGPGQAAARTRSVPAPPPPALTGEATARTRSVPAAELAASAAALSAALTSSSKPPPTLRRWEQPQPAAHVDAAAREDAVKLLTVRRRSVLCTTGSGCEHAADQRQQRIRRYRSASPSPAHSQPRQHSPSHSPFAARAALHPTVLYGDASYLPGDLQWRCALRGDGAEHQQPQRRSPPRGPSAQQQQQHHRRRSPSPPDSWCQVSSATGQ
eukprot:TRINITY_DN8394_c0_g1_i8.p1 TRINITY_DN8394_c0_g1~~TRINITY_DN8394_c0_g1_i8.p1  ORF type:complete len:505 (+),score=115.44 TRINITY_DN8394_c0_g1_i8:200-1516(+)